MAVYNTPDDLLAQIRALTQRIEALETGAPIRNASLSDGGQLIVKSSTGQTTVLLGRSDNETLKAPDGHKQMIVGFWRDSGEPAFALFDPLPAVDGFHQFWALYDRTGNIVAGDDTTSGQGLARPYVPLAFATHGDVSVPDITTTSGTFANLQTCHFRKQQPRIEVVLYARCSAGDTTGEVRLWNATRGEQVGSTITLGLGAYQAPAILGAINGDHMQRQELVVQARRTAGTGTVGVRVVGASGFQS